jgi:hypothetical protein
MPLIANMISFVNINNLCKWKNIHIMMSRVAHWTLQLIVLHFSMQRGDIFERTNGKCHVFTFRYLRGRYS